MNTKPKRSDMEAALRDYDRQVMKLTAQRDELLKACERARDHLIMDIDRSGAGILSHDSPEALKQCKAAINGSTFEGHEIPFNLHSKIRDLLSQRDELLAALKRLTSRSAAHLDQTATHEGLTNCDIIARARAAIAKAESNQT